MCCWSFPHSAAAESNQGDSNGALRFWLNSVRIPSPISGRGRLVCLATQCCIRKQSRRQQWSLLFLAEFSWNPCTDLWKGQVSVYCCSFRHSAAPESNQGDSNGAFCVWLSSVRIPSPISGRGRLVCVVAACNTVMHQQAIKATAMELYIVG